MGTLIFTSWPINSTVYSSIATISNVLPGIPPVNLPHFAHDQIVSLLMYISVGMLCFALQLAVIKASTPFVK